MGHHKSLSPSSFPALLQCACFESRGDDQKTDDYDDKGTEIHAYTLNPLAGKALPETNLLDQSDREDCEWATREIEQFCKDNAPGEVIRVEEKVQLFDRNFDEVTFGTTDVLCANVTGDVKSGLDYTSDWKQYIPQVDVYALCAMNDSGRDSQVCFLLFVKARKLIPFVRTRAECEATVQCAIARREDPSKSPLPCQFCKFCAWLLRCPAINPRLNAMESCFRGLPLGMACPEDVRDVKEMSQMLAFVRLVAKPAIKRVEALVERVEKAAVEMSNDFQELPYFVRTIKPGAKFIPHEVEIEGEKHYGLELALSMSGLPKEEFYETLKISIPTLAKKYASHKGLTEKAGRSELEGELDQIIARGEPKATLEFFPDPSILAIKKERKGKKS